MDNSLLAYSGSNFKYRVRETSINIKKAENGYIFELHGEKELPPPTKKTDIFVDRWERFSATFVYGDLNKGLEEVEGFFELIEKMLKKTEPKK